MVGRNVAHLPVHVRDGRRHRITASGSFPIPNSGCAHAAPHASRGSPAVVTVDLIFRTNLEET
jgi:hypothetical protein